MSVIQQFVHRRRSLKWIWTTARRYKQMTLALSLLFGVIVLHSFLFFYFESVKQPKLTLLDSFWVTFTTVTTVGYGDISAQTLEGRISTILLGYVLGLSLFAWVGSEVVSRLLERMLNRRRGMVNITSLQGHYLIVGFPSEEKVRLLIERLHEQESTTMTPLVVITDTLAELPFDDTLVHFVRGSVTNPDSYRRANIEKASQAIVLANDHEDPTSDAITAAAVSIIESLNPEIQTVAECVYEEHLTLFRHVKCDQIVLAGDMLIKLLVQETEDQGAARAISRLLESAGNELYSVDVGQHAAGATFREVLWSLSTSDQQLLPVGFRRDGEVSLNPSRDIKLREDDSLIFLSPSRPKWKTLPASLVKKE